MASLHSVPAPPAAAPPGAAGKDAAQTGPVPGSLTEDVPESYTSPTHAHQLFPATGIVAELPNAEPATELFGAFAGPGLAVATSVAKTPGILKAKVSKQLALSGPGGPDIDLQAQVAALSAQLAESRAEAAALRCPLLADFGRHARLTAQGRFSAKHTCKWMAGRRQSALVERQRRQRKLSRHQTTLCMLPASWSSLQGYAFPRMQ